MEPNHSSIKSIYLGLEIYEPIVSSSEKLTGGFSVSFSFDPFSSKVDFNSNNCLGGNCSPGCDIQQNMGCNAYSGCGKN